MSLLISRVVWLGWRAEGGGWALFCATKFGIFVRQSVDGDGFEELSSRAASNAFTVSRSTLLGSGLWLVGISAACPGISEALPPCYTGSRAFLFEVRGASVVWSSS